MSERVTPIPRKQNWSFTLHVYDRADGIAKVTLEIADDLVPVVGETVRVRVVEVVREVVER
jgi:hypothetical protein